MREATQGDAIDRHIGRTVRGLLFDQRRSQRELAAYLGVDSTVVSKMIHGRRSWTIAELWATAQMLGVEPGDLLPENMARIAVTHQYASWDDSFPVPREHARVA